MLNKYARFALRLFATSVGASALGGILSMACGTSVVSPLPYSAAWTSARTIDASITSDDPGS
jgi:hypothetical protein